MSGSFSTFWARDDGSRDPERSRGVRSVAKMDSVRVLVAKGRGIARVSRAMGMSCAQRNVLPTGRTGAVTGVMTTQTRNTVGFPQYYQ